MFRSVSLGHTVALQQRNSARRWEFIDLWILFCVFCSVTGWTLSAFRALNWPGYLISFIVWVSAIFAMSKIGLAPGQFKIPRLRFPKRLLPRCFLCLAFLTILGGIIHPPSNYDGLAYRTPKVLHWLAEGQWHWIHTDFHRMNTRGASFEWITAPFLLFTKSDRAVFLINAVCFVLLPGRVFNILKRLNVRHRTAWFWMWLFPTGFGFVLQAGSIASDLFGTICALAAVEYALKARERGSYPDFWFSVLSAALMTASKAFNLLLLLPWAVALLPSCYLFFRRPVFSVAASIIAVIASLIPTAVLNVQYAGDWTGLAVEPVPFGSGPPLFHIAINTILLGLYNLAPPVFPFAGAWNRIVEALTPASVKPLLHAHFETDAAHFRFGELQIEENAGLGLGVGLLFLGIIFQALFSRRCPQRNDAKPLIRFENLIALGAWVAALVYMARSGLATPARYLLPFYLLMVLPILAMPAAAAVTRKRWWRACAAFSMIMAATALVLTPARPLWPWKSALALFGGETSSNGAVKRAWTVYSTYASRPEAFAPLGRIIPDDAKPLAFTNSDYPETSLWKPFGSRRILNVKISDTPETFRRRGIRYYLTSSEVLALLYNMSQEEWSKRFDAVLVGQAQVRIRARTEPLEWYLFRLETNSIPDADPGRKP